MLEHQPKSKFHRTGWWIIVFIVAEMSRGKGRRKAYRVLLAFLEVRNILSFVFFCLVVEMSLEISLVSKILAIFLAFGYFKV